MRWSFAAVGVIVAGLIGVTIILLFQQITTNNESDYYLLKEITEAAMIESVDINHYRTNDGELKISREKFVENFTRRFAESTNLTGTGYTLNFFDIMETPPKVSIIINTGLGQYKIFEDTSDYNVQNRLDAILEYVSKDESVRNLDNPYETAEIKKIYYSLPNNQNNAFSDTRAIAIPEELKAVNIKNIKIENIKQIPIEDSRFDQGTLNEALLLRNINFVYTDADKANNPNIENVPYAASIDNFTRPNTLNIYAINCKSSGGFEFIGNSTDSSGISCNDNKYWVKLSGKTKDNSKSSVIINYEITWSYDEYKYS